MGSAPRYEILDTIASGDFAVVYRARDRELAASWRSSKFISNSFPMSGSCRGTGKRRNCWRRCSTRTS